MNGTQASHFPSQADPGTDPIQTQDPNFLKYARVIQDYIDSEEAQSQTNLQGFLNVYRQARTAELPRSPHEADVPQDCSSALAFLSSPDGNAIVPANENNLSHPMSHYFISSSHNTYLTGNQLYSESSVDGYMKALRACCRCVEIDVWDGKGTEEEQVEQEVAHIEDRLSHINDDRGISISGTKSSDSRFHFRDKLGFPRKFEIKSDVVYAAKDKAKEKTKEALGNAQVMPEPWKASLELEPEPRVLHGHTLTKMISFRYVCKAIAATAFVTSDLPIIVSLEVHCTLQQQARMVEIMQHVWSDHLLDVSRYATGNEPEYTAALPAPEALRKKILIKVKYTPPEKAKPAKSQKTNKDRSDSSDDESEEEHGGDHRGDQAHQQAKKKILDELSLLGVYTRSFHFKNFLQKEAQIATHVFALSENKIKWAIEDHSLELARHNKKFLMRAYPKGVRISSSNLNPVRMWRHGVQMVALNWQSCDKSMMLNEGMFGGTKGWVLKPRSFWDPDLVPPADATSVLADSSSSASNSSEQESHTETLAPRALPAQKNPLFQETHQHQPPEHYVDEASNKRQESSLMRESVTSSPTPNLESVPIPSPQIDKASIDEAATTATHGKISEQTELQPRASNGPQSLPSYSTPAQTSTQTKSLKLFSSDRSFARDEYMLKSPKHLNFSITFYSATDLPMPELVKDKNFKPYVKCILHTEAVPSQHRSRSASRNTSPHAQSGRHIGYAKETIQAARARASSMLKDHNREQSSSSTRKPNSRSEERTTRAQPRHKQQTAVQKGTSPDFQGETISFRGIAVDTEPDYMTFVRIKVMHDVALQKDELAAWGCARLGRLRNGFGWWHLKNRMGEDSSGKLLVKIKWDVDDE